MRTAQQAKQLAALIARAPKVSIEVVRTYSRCAAGIELASDEVRFAPPWPWLPEDRERDRWKFRLTAPGISIDMLSGAIDDGLRRVFDTGDDDFRELWRTIWRALDACERKPVQLPFGLLHRGFSGFSADDHGSSTSLRNEILGLSDRLSAEHLVTISAT